MNWLSIVVLFGILQGVILFLAIIRTKKGNVKANRLLAYFILIISLTLSGRYFYTLHPFTLLNAKILFVGDFIIFLLGPMLYFYLLELFKVKPDYKVHPAIHSLTVVIYLIIIFPFFTADREGFIGLSSNYLDVFAGIEIFAILQNLAYVILCSRILNRYAKENDSQNSSAPQIKFYNVLLGITLTGLIFWAASLGFRLLDPDGAGDYLGYQLVWIALSCAIIALGYYTLKNPEVISVYVTAKKYESKPSGIENINELSTELEKIMREKKPYLNPRLTLSELAEISGINSHLLSRIINEKHQRNFFTYINSYRIDEFKKIVERQENKNLTLLAIAYEAGFNSKTTFNTAFKKLTNQTPKEFYRLAANVE